MARAAALALLVVSCRPSDLPRMQQAGMLSGATSEDPLIGSWLNPQGDDFIGTGAVCDFFPNRAWNGDCINLYGYGSPTTWERLGDNRYFFATTGHKCWVDASFSDDGTTLSLRCGSYRPSWMGTMQPPVPLAQTVNLVRYRYP